MEGQTESEKKIQELTTTLSNERAINAAALSNMGAALSNEKATNATNTAALSNVGAALSNMGVALSNETEAHAATRERCARLHALVQYIQFTSERRSIATSFLKGHCSSSLSFSGPWI
jgi:hypothetical protein